MKPCMRVVSYLAALALASAMLFAQSQVTTTGGATNTVPKFTDTSTVGNSQIFDTGSGVGVGTSSPESFFHLYPPTTAQYATFGSVPWSLRIGSLQSGKQFISLGVIKAAADENYVARTGDNPAVSHTLIQMDYDGSLHYKVQPHQPDGTTLNMSDRFMVDPAGRFGVGTSSPESLFEVQGSSANWAKFNFGSPWGLRLGALQRGSQFISLGVGRATTDDNYVALTTNNPYVNHSVIEMRVDGSIGFLQQPHQPDGTTLSMTEYFTLGSNGNVGVGTTAPSQKLEVNGNIRTSGGVIFPDGTMQTTAAVTTGGTITGVSAGSGLSGGGSSGNVTLSVDGTVARTNASQTFSGVQYFADTIRPAYGMVIYNNYSNSTDIIEAICRNIGYCLAFGQNGNLSISGYIYKAGGTFKIDHPLDPENKYLYHSFVESPDMKNFYDGIVTLDEAGQAWVELPAWFEALNRDFRYQLTAVGAPGPGLYIASEISGNRFQIAGGKPGAKVSWSVTGIRQDAYAKAHPIAVEEDKPDELKGFYLHPTEHGQPLSKSIGARLRRQNDAVGPLE